MAYRRCLEVAVPAVSDGRGDHVRVAEGIGDHARNDGIFVVVGVTG
jgi:hypothetical protein